MKPLVFQPQKISWWIHYSKKHLLEQGFLHNLFSSSTESACSISDLELLKPLIIFLNYSITLVKDMPYLRVPSAPRFSIEAFLKTPHSQSILQHQVLWYACWLTDLLASEISVFVWLTRKEVLLPVDNTGCPTCWNICWPPHTPTCKTMCSNDASKAVCLFFLHTSAPLHTAFFPPLGPAPQTAHHCIFHKLYLRNNSYLQEKECSWNYLSPLYVCLAT